MLHKKHHEKLKLLEGKTKNKEFHVCLKVNLLFNLDK